MLTVTFKQFLTFKPCWLAETGGKARLKEYFKNGALSALDILKFDDVPSDDKLWAVLREELITAHILHEFGCRCAERAYSRLKNPVPYSLEAIRVKRLWLKGAATDEELEEAENAAEYISCVGRDAAWSAKMASLHAREVVWGNPCARKAELQWQVEALIRMLEEATNNNNKKEGKPK